MFTRRKKQPPAPPPRDEQPRSLFRDAISWESSRVEMLESSARRAWLVASIAIASSAALVVAIVLMLPLKRTDLAVIRMDNTTGAVDIVTTLNTRDTTLDEVKDKYWLANYVQARETYEWFTLQKSYDTVGLMSSATVGAEYNAQFEGANALHKKWGSSMRVTTEIVSVVPNGKGIGTVRFTKTSKRPDEAGSTGTTTRWVATIGYEYRNPSSMREADRQINPFNFRVLSYRVDPEMGGGR